jgi:hypothetical protein
MVSGTDIKRKKPVASLAQLIDRPVARVSQKFLNPGRIRIKELVPLLY